MWSMPLNPSKKGTLQMLGKHNSIQLSTKFRLCIFYISNDYPEQTDRQEKIRHVDKNRWITISVLFLMKIVVLFDRLQMPAVDSVKFHPYVLLFLLQMWKLQNFPPGNGHIF